MSPEAFRALLRDPKTGPRLDAMIADNARVDAQGPRECCADWAAVESCDGLTDRWVCPWCGRTWEAPCR